MSAEPISTDGAFGTPPRRQAPPELPPRRESVRLPAFRTKAVQETPPSYRREFARSPHHAGLALAAVGAACVLGPAFFPLSLIAGGAAYVLGWVYLPDLRFFRRWVDRRKERQILATSESELAEFARQREAALARLSTTRRNRYLALAGVCRDIEHAAREDGPDAGGIPDDPRLRKLDELMWTYLRLLSLEESLDRFLELESREQIPTLLREAETEVRELSAEVDALKARSPQSELREARERLLASRLERLEVLRKRQQRSEQARANLDLVLSEQERLDQQIKLIRADAMAVKNTGGLSARIDATVEHLHETNRWLAEMDEFKDLVGDLPRTPGRIGYEPLPAANPRQAPPPLPVGSRRKA